MDQKDIKLDSLLLSRPVHKHKQIGLQNDELRHDPDMPLQLRKGNKFHLTTFTEHICQK